MSVFVGCLNKKIVFKKNSPSIHHSEYIPLSRQSSLLLFYSLSPLSRLTCSISIRHWWHSHSFSPFIFISFARYRISTRKFAFIYYSPALSANARVCICKCVFGCGGCRCLCFIWWPETSTSNSVLASDACALNESR